MVTHGYSVEAYFLPFFIILPWQHFCNPWRSTSNNSVRPHKCLLVIDINKKFDLTDSVIENYRSVCDVKHSMTNNISFECLHIHYQYSHSTCYQTHCYTSDNVCLDVHNCHYSIYILTHF